MILLNIILSDVLPMYKICLNDKSLARQRELENGFLEYLNEESIFKLEISDLCRYLEIPRKTFYRYFGSREDALFALIDHRLEDMVQYLLTFQQADVKDPKQLSYHFFTFWRGQQRFLDILNENLLLSILTTRAVLRAGKPSDSEQMSYDISEMNTPESYMTNFATSGMMSMMLQWYHSGFQMDIDQLSQIGATMLTQPIFKANT